VPQALPGVSSSTAPIGSRAGGILRVVSNSELDAFDKTQSGTTVDPNPKAPTDLARYIRTQWEIYRNHRNTGDDPLNQRLLRAQRMFEGKYDPEKLQAIQKFGGSQVYSRLVAVKCRGATSLLRDVYLGPDRPWDIQPAKDVPVDPAARAAIMQLVSTEVATNQQAGKPSSDDEVHARVLGLMHAAAEAAQRTANQQAKNASDKIDDILVAGRFYEAMAAFLIDLPLFPFACIKGPVVRMVPKLTWVNRKASIQNTAQMFWERVSPFDLYWTPGASEMQDANVIQRGRLSRSDLNDLIGLPGYDEQAIRGVLEDYGRGLRDWLDAPDTEQAIHEGRENPTSNRSELIDSLEFHGQVQGQVLLDNGMDPKDVPDPLLDYSIQSWVVGRYTIKTQINPSPRQRHPYFLTSFEKVPGTVHGHGLPDLLEDLQEVCNAALRSLVNNMSIASGPQVVINDEVLAANEDSDELYPWKRWHVVVDPMANNTRDPITFFQPQSNSAELLNVYQATSTTADEISAIPRYITGSSQNLGGAGRTASGLSMLMGNAEKVLQTVAANVDNDVMQPCLTGLYDMIMLTDETGLLSGEEDIRVRGVNVAVQQETERSKQLQWLQITANPIDAPIIGPLGRARVLRAVAQGIGLPDDIVPSDEAMQAQLDAQKQQQQVAAALGGPPGAPGQPGAPGAPGQPGAPNAPPKQQPGMGNQSPPETTPQQASAQQAPPVNLQQQGLPA
jgi:hypothetical protein